MGRQKTRDALDGRRRLLAALFEKAARLAIDQRTLRDEIAPGVIGKRLSGASSREIVRVLDHITGLYGARLTTRTGEVKKSSSLHPEYHRRYASTRAGLVEELTDAARERWGEEWERSLNAFVNAKRKAPTHWKFLRVADLKAVKERIVQLNIEERGNGRRA